MNPAAFDGFNGGAGVRDTLAVLLVQSGLGAVACSYRARGSRAYEPSLGRVSNTETITPITAVITPLAEKDAAEGWKVGDVTILISAAELATTPRVDDRVIRTSDNAVYAVLSVESYGMETHHSVTARKA